jgi:UDP-glucuronate 4-epimerase
MDRKHALVTGGAGFIGSHLVHRLMSNGWRVTVVDNFDPFYCPAVKRANLEGYVGRDGFELTEMDIRNLEGLERQLTNDYEVIVHLAAKAGVRSSIEDPISYQDVNVRGTQNVLELARKLGVRRVVFASSSSVYGVNPNVPWREDECVLKPISPYASSKVSGELMGHVYSYLYGIRFVALRFFTAYGPRQRPDMAIHKFATQILQNQPISLFGDGRTRRDYTYVDDVVSGICAAMRYDQSMYEIINIGNSRTVTLLEMVQILEDVLRTRAKIDYQPMQPGDVPETYADQSKARRLLGFEPRIELREGIRRFADWYRLWPSACGFLS